MNKKEYTDAVNEIKASNNLKRETLNNITKKKNDKKITAIASTIIVFVLAISIITPIGLNKNKTNPIELAKQSEGRTT